jgi:ribonuclease D
MTLITDQDALAAFCARQANADYLTVDTEFLRESTYWPILCLVQIAGPDEAAAVDPLAEGLDLTPLYELMANERVLKVFHSARQDVEIFVKLTGRVPTPLFDTQVAAMVCGFGESVGYETLVTKLAGVRIDKSSRFTDWSRRPLTEKQLHYALADVTHLRPIYDKLRRRLTKSGRERWLDEEMAVLTDAATYIVEPRDAWQRIKTRSSDPRFLAILRELAAWRETEAQKRNQPRGRILRDDALIEIAAHAPRTVDELARTRGLTKNMAEGWQGAGLLAAVERGLAVPPSERPRLEQRPELPPGIGPTVELLRVLLKMKCEDNDVAQKLVATVSDLEQIAADDNADVPALHGWRRELFGEDALALKHGRISLAIENGRVKVVPVT